MIAVSNDLNESLLDYICTCTMIMSEYIYLNLESF